MNIELNGLKKDIEIDTSLNKFIENLSESENIDLSGTIILINDNLIKKKDWSNILLKENDKIEILSFVSGG